MTTTQKTPVVPDETGHQTSKLNSFVNKLFRRRSDDTDRVLSEVRKLQKPITPKSISHGTIPLPTKHNRVRTFEAIVQPKLQVPLNKADRPKPPHKPRKRKLSGPISARPEMAFSLVPDKFDLSDRTQASADSLISVFADLKDLLAEKLPSSDERTRIHETLDSLSESISKISDRDLNTEFSGIAAKLKNDLSRSIKDHLPSRKDLGVFVLGITLLVFVWNPSKPRAVAVGIALGFLLVTTDLITDYPLLIAILGVVSAIGVTTYCKSPNSPASTKDIDEDDLITAKPEMDMKDIQDSITAITSMLALYISTTTGKNIPVELFKNFGAVARVKGGIADAVAVVISMVETIVNWLRDKLFDLPSMRFFHTSSVKVTDFVERVDHVFEQERNGEFARIEENYDIIRGIVTDGNILKSQMPRDASSQSAHELLNKTLQQLGKLCDDFARHRISKDGGRQEAVGVVLKGGPGVGKSITMELLNAAILAQILPEKQYKVFQEKPSTFVFNRQAEVKYWDSYTAQHLICMFDDLFQAREVAGNPDGEAMNLLRCGSAFPMDMHTAAMESKGMVKFNSLFIMCTTNMSQLTTEVLNSMEALNRRLDFHIVVCPKRQYCSDETRELDLYQRRFDWSKVPKEWINVEGRYRPGRYNTTKMNADCQEFYLCKSDDGVNYVPDGDEALDFDELVELIMKKYEQKRLFFNMQKIEQRRIARKFRHESYTEDTNTHVFEEDERETLGVRLRRPQFGHITPDEAEDLMDHRLAMRNLDEAFAAIPQSGKPDKDRAPIEVDLSAKQAFMRKLIKNAKDARLNGATANPQSGFRNFKNPLDLRTWFERFASMKDHENEILWEMVSRAREILEPEEIPATPEMNMLGSSTNPNQIIQMEPIPVIRSDDSVYSSENDNFRPQATFNTAEPDIKSFSPQNTSYLFTKPSFQEALANLKKKGPEVEHLEFCKRAITGYSSDIQVLVEDLCRYHRTELDIPTRREYDVAIDNAFRANFSFHVVPPMVVCVAELVLHLGESFVLAFISTKKHALKTYLESQWGGCYVYVEKVPKNSFENFSRGILDHVQEAKKWYNIKLLECPSLGFLMNVINQRPYLTALVTIVSGTLLYKLFAKAVSFFFSFATPESLGHSDKLKSSRAKQKAYRSTSELHKAMGLAHSQMGNAMPQSCGLDPNGINIAESIGKKRVYEFQCETNFGTNNMRTMGYVTMVTGRIGIMPYHFIAALGNACIDNPKYMQGKVLMKKPNSGHSYEFTVLEIIKGHKTGALQHSDIVLVEFPRNMQPVRDGTEYFASRADFKSVAKNIPFILYLGNRGGGPAYIYGTANARDKPLRCSAENIGTYHARDTYFYNGCTKEGDCGAPFFAMNSAITKRKIFGIHIAGSEEAAESYSGAIALEDLLEDLKLFDAQPELEEDPDDVTPQANIEPFSKGQFDEVAVVRPAPTRNFTTAIRRSRLFGAWGDAITAPALLRKDTDAKGNLIDPVALAQSKYCFPAVWFNQELIDQCRDVYYSHIVHVHTVKYEKRLLTIREAINGIETELESNGIAASTSAGYPMNVQGKPNRKKWLFEYGREGEIFEQRLEQITSDVEHVENKYKNNIRPSWFFTDCLKDERRPLAKVASGSTRMFSGCPFYYLIIFKKYFGTFVLESIANRVRNGSAVGMNPYSADWNALAQMLTKFDTVGSSVGAGDYAGFDGSEKPRVHYATLDIINRWYGDSIENQRIRSLLWLDLVNSRHIMDGVAYEWSSSLPSGHPFTIWANNMYNEMAFLMCWSKLGGDLDKFYENVYLCRCGDDNIFTVHPDYREMFNEITICAPMKELGLTYTTETKGEAIYPFRNLEDVEFLKRSFRFETTRGLWLAPLRLNVVLEIPYWTKRTSDKHSIAVSNVIESLRELSLHSKKTYDKYESIIIEECQKAYPEIEPPRPLVQSYANRQAEACRQVMFF